MAITQKFNRDGGYSTASESSALSVAGAVSGTFINKGFKDTIVTFKTNTTTDTNTATAILWVSIDGTNFFNAASVVADLAAAGVVQKLSYEGYAEKAYLELDAIGGGSPTISNIAFASYNEF